MKLAASSPFRPLAFLALALLGPAPAAQDQSGLPPASAGERVEAVVAALEAQYEVSRSLREAASEEYARAVVLRDRARVRLKEVEASLDAAVADSSLPAAALDAALRDLREVERDRDEARRRLSEALERVRAQQAEMEFLEEKIALLREDLGTERGLLTGTWDVTFLPSGTRGVFLLRQAGALITGQYTLGGGWAGSLRGTYVSGELHLERIDARRGRDAELKGALASGEDRIRGTWQAYQLSEGTQPQGSWVAVRRP
jgi:hypothetical protein